MTWTTRPRSEGAGALAYCAEGRGPAVVLIHGVGLRAEAWNAVSKALAPDFTVYTLDMPGHGASPLAGAAQLNDYVARVLTFIHTLDAPIYFAGHSMGAMIAVEVAAQAPEKVAAVAGLNAIYRRSAEAAAAVQSRAAALMHLTAPDPAPTLARWFGAAPSGATVEAAAACRAWLMEVDPDGYAAAYGVFARHDGPSEDRLQRLQMPTLFQTGADDPNSTPEMSQVMAAKAPFGQGMIVAGAAHMMPMTHPEAVAEALHNCFTRRVQADAD
ncbi:alpha/beta fold hydrolase [uncultured Roseobacter sp.]|uniref:alpha/beta fold hydrolase n=1 Tax=uncultured Roseobacter sp. TaxID=114847 RepID=UPI0026232E4F|nr:alpha/beta fold hydrolase [uncultured Roseobacter sp.]